MPANLDISAPSPVPSDEELTRQVGRIVRSREFRGTETLRSLLSYLSSCAVAGRTAPLGAREIATAVFGRTQDFDSQNDSVVRVHTGRLRSKLAEYYMGEGAEDDVIISIPKGSYSLFSHYRQTGVLTPPNISLPSTVNEPLPVWHESANRQSIPIAVAVLLVILAVVSTWLMSTFLHKRVENVPQEVQTFWGGFAAGEQPPLVVFSNFKFVGSADGTLRPFVRPGEPDQPIIDTYTTMGEVMGVFEVGRVLALFHKSPRVKRGRLLTWDEAEDRNLIFIGGPLAETPLREVPILKEFKFREGTWASFSALENLHPRKGELPLYMGPGPYPAIHNQASLSDYAVVALRPALSRNHRILVLAGITEYGTQGAAEFVTRKEHIADLLSQLKVKPGGLVPWFEALLRVRIEGSVPVDSSIVMVHQTE